MAGQLKGMPEAELVEQITTAGRLKLVTAITSGIFVTPLVVLGIAVALAVVARLLEGRLRSLHCSARPPSACSPSRFSGCSGEPWPSGSSASPRSGREICFRRPWGRGSTPAVPSWPASSARWTSSISGRRCHRARLRRGHRHAPTLRAPGRAGALLARSRVRRRLGWPGRPRARAGSGRSGRWRVNALVLSAVLAATPRSAWSRSARSPATTSRRSSPSWTVRASEQ